mgnify:CR=1 FL=1
MNPLPTTPGSATDIERDLRDHLSLCREILSVVERENQSLRGETAFASFDFCQTRKQLLPRLSHSVVALYRHRLILHKLDPAERRQRVEGMSLLRQNQDLIMKILVLDRENEQALLRRGLVPAAKLPSVNLQRPHFVADLYRRNGNR